MARVQFKFKERILRNREAIFKWYIKMRRKFFFKKKSKKGKFYLKIVKRFTVEGARVKRRTCLNLIFQKSIWTFKIRIIKKKWLFYIISNISATSIWRNLYIWKYQELHWLLWRLHAQLLPISSMSKVTLPPLGKSRRDRKKLCYCFFHVIPEIPSTPGHKNHRKKMCSLITCL